MATTVFDWQGIQDAASELPDGLYALDAVQIAFLLAAIEARSTFRGNWEVAGSDPDDIEWDEISAFRADTERALMAGCEKESFMATKSTTQVVQPNVYTKVSWDTEVFGNLDLANNRFVASIAGKHFFSGMITLDKMQPGDRRLRLSISANGTLISGARLYGFSNPSPSGISFLSYSLLDLAVDDYVELFAKHTSDTQQTVWNNQAWSFFTGFFVG